MIARQVKMIASSLDRRKLFVSREAATLVLLVLFAYNTRTTASSRKGNRVEEARVVFGVQTGVYSFPYVCSLHFPKFNMLQGTCTIFDKSWVSINIDNLLAKSDGEELAQKIVPAFTYVVAGASRAKWLNEEEYTKTETTAMKTEVSHVYVPIDPYVVWNSTIADADVLIDPTNINIALDVHGAAFNIAFLKLANDLKWSPYILPLPLYEGSVVNILKDTRTFMKRLEKNPHLLGPCLAPGWGQTKLKRMKFIKLMYVPIDSCRSTWCSINMKNCLQFPYFRHLFCYKSLIFTDLCYADQGTPLFCDWYDGSILGFLSRTFKCGEANVPPVFTVISPVLLLFGKVAQTSKPTQFKSTEYTIEFDDKDD